MFHENKFMTNAKEKAKLLNAFFGKQWSLIKNSSNFALHLHYLTENHLSSVSFFQNNIARITQNLDPSKAHGLDKISIPKLKIRISSICKRLEMIFKQCIETGFQLSELAAAVRNLCCPMWGLFKIAVIKVFYVCGLYFHNLLHCWLFLKYLLAYFA